MCHDIILQHVYCPSEVFCIRHQVSVKWNVNQGLNSDRLVWDMSKSKHQKQQHLFLISSNCVMVSKFNIYTVHLKCFGSIRYPLNQFKTLTKNFNQGLNSGEYG